MSHHLPHHRRKNKNILTFLLGLTLAILLSRLPTFHQAISGLGNFGYLSAFIAGMLFASTFTVAIGGLIIINLISTISPFILIPIGMLGAVFSDVLIFLFVKDKISTEIAPIYEKFVHHSHFKKILHTKYFSWTLPVVGALVIASPFPDEIGISLLGISKITVSKFIIISSISHTIGMTSLILGSIFLI